MILDFFRLHSVIPHYFRNSDDKPHKHELRRKEIDTLATPWVNTQVAHLLSLERATAMVGDDQAAGNLTLSD